MVVHKVEMDHFVDSVLQESKAAFLDFIHSLEDNQLSYRNNHLQSLIDNILAAKKPSKESLKQLALLLPRHIHLYADAVKVKQFREEQLPLEMAADEQC